MSPLTRLLVWSGIFVGLFSGCVPAEVKARLDAQEEAIIKSQRDFEDFKEHTLLILWQIDNELRLVWSDRLCNSGKVAEFISQVQAGAPGICVAGSLATSLTFLKNEPYWVAYLDPFKEIAGMNLVRMGDLRNFLDPSHVHASTKLLVMVQPSDESDTGQQKALQVADHLVSMIRKKIVTERELRVLGPHLLPCRLQGDVRKLYHGPRDIPLHNEPMNGIKIWAFRVDC